MKTFSLTTLVICASMILLSATTYDADLTKEFNKNKGKLPWPVEGSISVPFGVYKIGDTKIRGRNAGITISTTATDLPVKSVFNGIIDQVDRGELTTVYIRHGKYSTVYSNLSDITVHKGEEVTTGQTLGHIGEAYAAPGGELNFLLMVDNNNVNPALWLHK